MKLLSKINVLKLTIILLSLSILTGCASFTGLRTPNYDGEPIVFDEEASELYEETNQIDEDNEDLYYRYPLSDTLFDPSLDFSDNESVLLEEGAYTVGEDLPEGRVFLESESSDFRPDFWIIHTGNMTVYDEEEAVVFENHFQDHIGIMQATIDLYEGYTIEIIGEDPLITVHYSEPAVENNQEDYAFIAGHYEVGRHIEPGLYHISEVLAPRTTVLYHLTHQGEWNVIELHSRMELTMEANEELYEYGVITEEEYELNKTEILSEEQTGPLLELHEGDKLYIPMIDRIIFTED